MSGKDPRPFVRRVIDAIQNRRSDMVALDLGCGVGNETRYLIEHGFTVDSLDANPSVLEYVPNAIISTFEEHVFSTDSYDIIIASMSLPFCAPNNIDIVVSNIKQSIRSGGIFAGHFLGQNDTWYGHVDMSFHTRKQVHDYFNDFMYVDIAEKEFDRDTATGEPHHWHMYEIIAIKGV